MAPAPIQARTAAPGLRTAPAAHVQAALVAVQTARPQTPAPVLQRQVSPTPPRRPLPRAASGGGTIQRTINFGDAWDSFKDETIGLGAKVYDQAMEMGNMKGVKEIEVRALRTAEGFLPGLEALMDFPGTEASVTISRGIHIDNTFGRDNRPHQTVVITVQTDSEEKKRSKWAYHVIYEPSKHGEWRAIDAVQQTNNLNPLPKPPESVTIWGDGVQYVPHANLVHPSAINTGPSHYVGGINVRPTGKTYGKLSEVEVVKAPRYVGLEGESWYIPTKQLSG